MSEGTLPGLHEIDRAASKARRYQSLKLCRGEPRNREHSVGCRWVADYIYSNGEAATFAIVLARLLRVPRSVGRYLRDRHGRVEDLDRRHETLVDLLARHRGEERLVRLGAP